MSCHPELVLASASPRRANILRQIGVKFCVAPVTLDETPAENELPLAYVSRIARAKAGLGWQNQLEAGEACLPVLGADTCVVLGQQILGKPGSAEEACEMLLSLSGQSHRVLTAVSLCGGNKNDPAMSEEFSATSLAVISATTVTFRDISAQEAERYWLTGEPQDKAGSYAIQGLGAVFVEKIEGSYSGVVGLPVAETCSLLAQFGVTWWN